MNPAFCSLRYLVRLELCFWQARIRVETAQDPEEQERTIRAIQYAVIRIIMQMGQSNNWVWHVCFSLAVSAVVQHVKEVSGRAGVVEVLPCYAQETLDSREEIIRTEEDELQRMECTIQ